MPASESIRHRRPAPSAATIPPSELVGRRVRITATSARHRSLTVVPVGVVTQVLDLGFTTLLRVRGAGLDGVEDVSPDEIELVD